MMIVALQILLYWSVGATSSESVFTHKISYGDIIFELREGSFYAIKNLQMICLHVGQRGTSELLWDYSSWLWVLCSCSSMQWWQKVCPHVRVTGFWKKSWHIVQVKIAASGWNPCLCSSCINLYIIDKIRRVISFVYIKLKSTIT